MESVNLREWMEKYKTFYHNSKASIEYFNSTDSKQNKSRDFSPLFEKASSVFQDRGYLFKEEFLSIAMWKTSRQRRNYIKNSEEDIKRISSEVINQHLKPEERLEILTKLKGVGVPVASALLTVIFPREYCVVDYRAWRALLWLIRNRLQDYPHFHDAIENFRNYNISIDSYVSYYLPTIQELGEEYNMTPREVEMALWMYDKKKGES